MSDSKKAAFIHNECMCAHQLFTCITHAAPRFAGRSDRLSAFTHSESTCFDPLDLLDLVTKLVSFNKTVSRWRIASTLQHPSASSALLDAKSWRTPHYSQWGSTRSHSYWLFTEQSVLRRSACANGIRGVVIWLCVRTRGLFCHSHSSSERLYHSTNRKNDSSIESVPFARIYSSVFCPCFPSDWRVC